MTGTVAHQFDMTEIETTLWAYLLDELSTNSCSVSCVHCTGGNMNSELQWEL